MLWPKKNSYKEFDNEKKFLQLENSPPPPPHNFSNGPSLSLCLFFFKFLLYTKAVRIPNFHISDNAPYLPRRILHNLCF